MVAINTARRLAGVASITIDGFAYDVVSDLVWSPSTVKRETLAGQTRVEGFSEMPVAGFVAGVIRDNALFSVRGFNALVNSTVIVQQANGKTIMGSGMWSTEVQEVKTQEGSFNVRFEGSDVTELVLAQ